ncbi:hypothetical protein Bbelb_053790 [Branchiostoma belcheri]|nr:hypothetical protein Bbelb_053790 [Branchiostoma belcheri]
MEELCKAEGCTSNLHGAKKKLVFQTLFNPQTPERGPLDPRLLKCQEGHTNQLGTHQPQVPRSHVDVDVDAVTIGVLGMYTQNKKSDVECGRDETAALVKYIALYYSVEKGQPDEKLFPWATTKKEEFWDR